MTAERTQDLIARIYRALDGLEAEIARLDRQIQGKVPLHVKAKWKRCGKPRCACQRGRKHGPYLYAYIPDEEVRARRREKGGRGSTRKEVYLGKDFTPPEIREIRGNVKNGEVVRALEMVRQNNDSLLEWWREIHGDC